MHFDNHKDICFHEIQHYTESNLMGCDSQSLYICVDKMQASCAKGPGLQPIPAYFLSILYTLCTEDWIFG